MKNKFIKNSYIIDVVLFAIASIILLLGQIGDLEKYVKVVPVLIGLEAILSIIRGIKYKTFYIVEGIINILFAILVYVDKYSSIDNLMVIFVIWAFVINICLLLNVVKGKEKGIKYYDILLVVIGMFAVFDYIYIFGYKPHSLSACLIIVAIIQWYTGKKIK